MQQYRVTYHYPPKGKGKSTHHEFFVMADHARHAEQQTITFSQQSNRDESPQCFNMLAMPVTPEDTSDYPDFNKLWTDYDKEMDRIKRKNS